MGGADRAGAAGAAPAAADGYEPFDPEYLKAVCERLLEPVAAHYFRPRLIRWKHIPTAGPCVIAPNHSGNALPYDAMILDATLWRHDGFDPAKKVRTVFEKVLTRSWWMRPFGIDNFYRKGGGVDLTFDNFDRVLARGDRVMYFPEGVPGIGKGFFRRYQLQHFHTSFVLLSARHNAPVVPGHIVNAEWTIPFTFTIGPLDRLLERFVGVPFLPLPWALLAIAIPALWYLALPCRMVFAFGKPFDTRAMLAEEGVHDLADVPRATLQKVADRIRDAMQVELDGLVERYGRWPYAWRSFKEELKHASGRWAQIVPLSWVYLFQRLQRDLRGRPPARSRFRAFVRDLDLLLFYVPFGWPLIALCRVLRRWPQGFRGRTAAERREIEGSFFWSLKERPLPPR